jgi:hypothetical protein
MEMARRLAEKTAQFHEVAQRWTAWPAQLAAVKFDHREDWPGYCMAELDKAVAAKDLAGVKHWAGELASATFSLADLHRWLAFLTDNYLKSLDFQLQCRPLFAFVDARQPAYDYQSTISQLPAGILCSNGKTNLYEVERQAERLFCMPPDRAREISINKNLTPDSLWILPGLRECYLKLRETLSPENQKTWDAAVRTPFEHSYMTNMLYRAWQTDTVDDLGVVLKKFDAIHPHALLPELMGVLMYRGHAFAGLEWDDRYQPQLREAAEQIPASLTDSEALLNACRWTHEFYHAPENYGPTLTLRDALQKRKLDCVRATDMMGAIYRNAGRTRFGNVRWSGEATGHSVAAYLGVENGKARTLLADGLMPTASLEVWPDCYFRRHDWPPSMESNPNPYCVELYVRGLDSYVWAEGYVIRGPNAGWLTTVDVPYLPNHRVSSTRKVFEGPYPE